MFLEFLICEPNSPFCKAYSLYMGYSLGKMADFQKRLLCPIFGVFSSGFLRRTTLMWLNNRFSHLFSIFDLWAKLTILQSLYSLYMGYSLGKMADSKTSHFSNIWCFFERLSAQNNCEVLVESFFACFQHFYFLSQTDHFSKPKPFTSAIVFARWPILKNVSFFQYLVFFWAAFCAEQL